MLTLGNWSFNTSNVLPVFYITQEKKNVKIQQSSQRSEKEKVNVEMADSQFNEMHRLLNFKLIK